MNQLTKQALTALGVALVTTAMETAAKKLANSNSVQNHENNAPVLVPAYSVQGDPNLYRDVNTLVDKTSVIGPLIDAISLAVVTGSTNLFKNRTVEPAHESEIITVKEIRPEHLQESVVEKLIQYKEPSTSGVAQPKPTPTKSTQPFNWQDTGNAHTTQTYSSLEQDEPNSSGSNGKEEGGKAQGAVKGIKEVIDHFNSQEKFHKISLLIEKIDESHEVDLEGKVVSVSGSKSMISTAVDDSKLTTLVHLYQDDKYTQTVGKSDILSHLTTLIFSKKLLIKRIRTINTYRNEFAPSQKWDY